MSSENKHTPISIYFHDRSICMLFSELLQSMGHHTTILSDISELETETKIITEPIYLPDIVPSQQSRCLLIGSEESLKNINTPSIAQPLTESKICKALEKFLSPDA